MAELAPLLHYSTVALTIALPAIGVSLGQGRIGVACVRALERQPSAQPELFRGLVMGMALAETAGIIGVALAIILLFGASSGATIYNGIAQLGIAIAVSIPSLVTGLTTAQPAIAALGAIARQPFLARKITNLMLITQSLGQTAVIFGFLIALFIQTKLAQVQSINTALQLVAAGFCMGVGSIGPAIGLGHFAQTACASAGVNRNAYPRILAFTFISEAIIETPVIFALVVALLLLQITPTDTLLSVQGISLISAALCTGMGTFIPGISSGRTAASACAQLAFKPEQYGVLSRLSLVAQMLIDTIAIYAVLVSLLLLFL